MRGLSAREDGWTLIELLVASAIAMVLIGVSVTLFTSLLQSEPRASGRSAQLEHGRVMLERITRELRQGHEALLADGGKSITLSTEVCESDPDGNGSCEVTYNCTGGTCTRLDEGGSQTVVVEGIDPSSGVFAVDPAAPSFVEVVLTFPDPEGAEAVTLRDGVDMRNYTADSGSDSPA